MVSMFVDLGIILIEKIRDNVYNLDFPASVT